MGTSARSITIQIPIDEAYTRKKSDVLSFIPIIITDNGTALPLEYHGSAHIHSFTRANGIMEIPLGINEIKKGEIVRVRPL
jgi:molybdopterin molybdotransferase